MVNKILTVAAASAAAIVLAACGQAPDAGKGSKAAGGSGSPNDAKDYIACMVSDQGGFDDKSFNESGYEGLMRAEKELGIKVKTAESKSAADFNTNVESLISQKCNLIIGVGFMLNNAVRDAARAHPEINFALIDAVFTEGKDKDTKVVEIKNGKPLVFNTAEAAYLTGYAAAAASKTGKVATFGGMKIPTVSIFMDGFVDGVKKYNEAKGKSVQVIGWDKDKQDGAFVGSFEDQAKGKQLSEQQLAQGADVIMPVAGPVGKGTLAAIKDKPEIMLVGVDSDWYNQYAEQKQQILTSVVKEIGQATYDCIKEAKEGKFTNEPYVGTLANGGVDMAEMRELAANVPADVQKEIQDLKKQIADGSLKVETPNNPRPEDR